MRDTPCEPLLARCVRDTPCSDRKLRPQQRLALKSAMCLVRLLVLGCFVSPSVSPCIFGVFLGVSLGVSPCLTRCFLGVSPVSPRAFSFIFQWFWSVSLGVSLSVSPNMKTTTSLARAKRTTQGSTCNPCLKPLHPSSSRHDDGRFGEVFQIASRLSRAQS